MSRAVRRAIAVVLLVAVGVAAGEWRRVEEPPALDLPRDHGAHPEVRTEWWYLTANLRGDDGRDYGVQVTFFRQGLDPSDPTPGDSPLRARQALAAHVAVAEVDGGRFRHAERLRRVDGGFAAMSTDDLVVRLGDWSLERREGDVLAARAEDRAAGLTVALEYRPTKPLVLQGDRGWSQKGPEPGNASAYLSWTRLAVSGTLELDGRVVEVSGEGWFDHEWGTSQLGEGVVGWDWFSLRLEGGIELMVYRLRRADGSADPFSSGTLVRPDGTSRRLGLAEVELVPTGTWTSPATGATYPSGWRIAIPDQSLALEVTPRLESAELDARASTGTVYWEGPVVVAGSRSGEGYAELTGYATSLADRF